MNTSTKKQKSQLKPDIYFIEQCLHSPTGHLYLQCIDQLFDSEFYKKLEFHLFPNADKIIYAVVWKIWQNLGETELKVTFPSIQYSLLQVVDREQFDKLNQEYEREFLDFARIIIKSVDNARLRLVLLQRCNLSDWLRLQWHVFKRRIVELTLLKWPVDWEQKREEDQLVYISRVMNDPKKNDKGNKIM